MPPCPSTSATSQPFHCGTGCSRGGATSAKLALLCALWGVLRYVHDLFVLRSVQQGDANFVRLDSLISASERGKQEKESPGRMRWPRCRQRIHGIDKGGEFTGIDNSGWSCGFLTHPSADSLRVRRLWWRKRSIQSILWASRRGGGRCSATAMKASPSRYPSMYIPCPMPQIHKYMKRSDSGS